MQKSLFKNIWILHICYILGIITLIHLPNSTSARTPQDTSGKRIVFLGNSITAGFGLSLEQAYPAIIQDKIDSLELKYECINAGLSGETTSGGLRRVDWIMQNPVDVLIIALGGNDGLRGIPPELSRQNIIKMVEKARKKYPGISIILAGMQAPPNMGEEYTESFNSIFKNVADSLNTGYIPFLLEDVGGREDMNQPDQIHPNVQGQKQVAENVWKVLKKYL